MDAIRERLDALLAGSDPESTRKNDPVDFVHGYEAVADREIAGLIAATLAFGNAVAAKKSIARVLDALGDEPGALVARADHASLDARLHGFVHRIYRAEHLGAMLFQAGLLLRAHGTLGDAFCHFHSRSGGDFREALARFADALRGDAQSRSARHLVSDPRAGSACKRLLLYARWMIRPADGIDLGLWPIRASELVIPVDTHVHRISRNLGLTARKTASWATAEEITDTLRRFDPDDPVKYDFAICHLGVSRECPSRPQPTKCAQCVLQDVCSVWRAGHVSSPKEAGELGLERM